MQQGLVIDDHPIVREGLKDLLKKAVPALSITTSPGTEGVLEEVCGRHWAFIVLDLDLPGIHGLDEASSKIGMAQSRGSRSICGGRGTWPIRRCLTVVASKSRRGFQLSI